MKNNKLKVIILIVVAVLVCSLAVGFIVSTTSSNRSSSSSSVSRGSNKTYTQLYSHHFDVVLTLDQAFGGMSSTVAAYGGAQHVDINFNVLSNNDTAYEKLSDMDGDGYIAGAFGVYTVGGQPFAVFDARLVNEGNIVIYVTNMTDGSVTTLVVPNMSGYAVEDSVSAI